MIGVWYRDTILRLHCVAFSVMIDGSVSGQRLKTDYWMSLVYEKLERYDREHNILDSTARRRLRSSDSDAHYSDAYGTPAIYFRP